MSDATEADESYRVVDAWFDENEDLIKYVTQNEDGATVVGTISRRLAPGQYLSKDAARDAATELSGVGDYVIPELDDE